MSRTLAAQKRIAASRKRDWPTLHLLDRCDDEGKKKIGDQNGCLRLFMDKPLNIYRYRCWAWSDPKPKKGEYPHIKTTNLTTTADIMRRKLQFPKEAFDGEVKQIRFLAKN
jgi:hypothetical protein